MGEQLNYMGEKYKQIVFLLNYLKTKLTGALFSVLQILPCRPCAWAKDHNSQAKDFGVLYVVILSETVRSKCAYTTRQPF